MEEDSQAQENDHIIEEEEEEKFDPSQLPPYFSNRLNEFLRSACMQGYSTWVNLLLQKGADVNDRDNTDKSRPTALHRVIQNGHDQLLGLLLPKSTPDNISVALRLASQQQQKITNVVKILKMFSEGEDKPPNEVTTTIPENSQPVYNPPDNTPQDNNPADGAPPDSNPPDNQQINEAIAQSREQVLELRKANETTQQSLQNHKIASEAKEKESRAHIERLENELKKEQQLRQEEERLVDDLEKELNSKDDELAKLKVQLEVERRAKETAKKILVGDGNKLQLSSVTKSSPSMHARSSSAQALIKMQYQSTGSFTPYTNNSTSNNNSKPNSTSTSSLSLSRPASAKNGQKSDKESKDDMYIEERSRVKRLVKRWETLKLE